MCATDRTLLGVVGFAAVAIGCLLACSGSSPIAVGLKEACVPGLSVACVGPGGCAGGQVCDQSGSGFGSCVCGSVDGGSERSDVGSGASAGSGDSDAGSGGSDGGGSDGSGGSGCTIGGTFYASGATANDGCEVCRPAESTTAWTDVTGSANCVSGEVCVAGSCAPPGQCAPSTANVVTTTVSSGALTTIPTSTGVGYQTTVGMGGYSLVYGDATAAPACTDGFPSTICLDSAALCATGQTGIASTPPNVSSPALCWGAEFGINLNQAVGSTTLGSYKPTGSGVTYALSALPSQTVHLQVTSEGGGYYCAVITAVSGTVPWTDFYADCWNPASSQGEGFTGPTPITAVTFVIEDGASPESFSFCVNSISL